MPVSVKKSNHDPKELYDRLIANDGRLTQPEIAKEFGLKAPLLTHYVVQYAHENKLPLPKLTFKKPVAVAKILKRSHLDRDLRISVLRITGSGMGEDKAFKLLGDANKRIMIVVPADTPVGNVEEAFRLLYDGQQPTGTPPVLEDDEEDGDDDNGNGGGHGSPAPRVRPLRLPGTSTSKAARKRAN